LAVRFESGVEAATIEQAEELRRLAGTLGEQATILDGADEADFWREVDAGLSGTSEHQYPGQSPGGGVESSVLLKASVLPTAVAPWLVSLTAETTRAGLAVRSRAHAGHGIIYSRLTGDADALAAAVEALREAATRCGGNLVVQEAPVELLRRVDVWGPSAAQAVMRRVKQRFDPTGTLNPGRFVGGV
jgi:glycolate oxidase FAD binding subunit